MAFTLPDLPYSHDALAGLGMSAETLEYHPSVSALMPNPASASCE